MDDFEWISFNVLTTDHPKAAHLLAHYDVWCVTKPAHILVFKKYYVQCNQHKSIALRMLETFKDKGATDILFFNRIYVPDSPSRYC